MILADLWRETPQDQLYAAVTAAVRTLPWLIAVAIGAWAVVQWRKAP